MKKRAFAQLAFKKYFVVFYLTPTSLYDKLTTFYFIPNMSSLAL